jgi:transcription initiation factor TFIIB
MSESLARVDMALSTIIGRSDKDASGHPLDAVMRTTMARLRTWDSRSRFHTSTDRNLQHAFDQLYALKDKLGLSDAVLEKTAYIYRKDQEASSRQHYICHFDSGSIRGLPKNRNC